MNNEKIKMDIRLSGDSLVRYYYLVYLIKANLGEKFTESSLFTIAVKSMAMLLSEEDNRMNFIDNLSKMEYQEIEIFKNVNVGNTKKSKTRRSLLVSIETIGCYNQISYICKIALKNIKISSDFFIDLALKSLGIQLKDKELHWIDSIDKADWPQIIYEKKK